jgi:hypothetical protein
VRIDWVRSLLGKTNMKKIVFAAFVAAVAVPATAAPGDTDTATGSATATIVAPIAIDHVVGAALAFGTITAGNGGTVTVALDGTVTDNGDDAVVLPGATTSADAFTLTGSGSRSIIVTVGDGVLTGPGTDMPFVTTDNAPTSLSAAGTGSFSVGGTLTVGNTQTPGDYTGTYTATATYN